MSWLSRLFGKKKKRKYEVFREAWRKDLIQYVPFYRSLSDEDKLRFEERILHFLNTTRITGIQTKVEDLDLVLVAAGAIIPVFGFPNWTYYNLNEVLLYPAHFDKGFNIGNEAEQAILGMVGFGYMNGQMVLSQHSLRNGFKNSKDRHNTAIHEFIHLMDKSDGDIDGVMVHFKEREQVLPWLHLMDEKIRGIQSDQSDIRDYGATNRAEFLAVAGEYFFERPKLLQKNHPELYAQLERLFNQSMSDRNLDKPGKITRHFDPCPCGSGKKFRECCMNRS